MKPTPVSKILRLCIAWILGICLIPVILLALIISVANLWNSVLPSAVIHYDRNGTEELRYIWNVQDRIYKGDLPPGASTADHGFLFPDDEFFMEFYWWSKKGRNHCANIKPKWPTTIIHLDANGDIDHSKGTDSDRLKQCVTDTARP